MRSSTPRLAVASAMILTILLTLPALGGEFMARLRGSNSTGHTNTAAYDREAYPGPGAAPYPIVQAGPQPWYGQAMGAPTFNYGYFGAHRHYECFSHVGYYGDYYQHGLSRGY